MILCSAVLLFPCYFSLPLLLITEEQIAVSIYFIFNVIYQLLLYVCGEIVFRINIRSLENSLFYLAFSFRSPHRVVAWPAALVGYTVDLYRSK